MIYTFRDIMWSDIAERNSRITKLRKCGGSGNLKIKRRRTDRVLLKMAKNEILRERLMPGPYERWLICMGYKVLR